MPNPEAASVGDGASASQESEICRNCGFCCDGTLFARARSRAGDTASSLVAIGLVPIEISPGGGSGFRLPCPQFTGRCSVYSSRPSVCAAFRCRLLQSVSSGKYTAEHAIQIVEETSALREALIPGLDAMYSDAVAAGVGTDRPGQSLVYRLLAVVSLLVRPADEHFREKHRKLLPTALGLARRLVDDFRPKRPGNEDDSLN